MTGEELTRMIRETVETDRRLQDIRKKIAAEAADMMDSEEFAEILAEIVAELLSAHVLELDGREEAFLKLSREQAGRVYDIFAAVQAILDGKAGIMLRAVRPEYQFERARKIANSLIDETVSGEVIQRRARSATENFIRASHDSCVRANAEFRSRAGYDAQIVRTGGAKCCDWCASVEGTFSVRDAPAGIWGRHDNCKCSIVYQTRGGRYQTLTGKEKSWNVVEESDVAPLRKITAEPQRTQQKKQRLQKPPQRDNTLKRITPEDLREVIVPIIRKLNEKPPE